MSMLICVNSPNWYRDDEMHEILKPTLGGITVHVGLPDAPLDDVVMLTTTEFDSRLVPLLPNLQLIQKLGAGVETMAGDPALPEHVRIARLASHNQATEIAEYFLAYVLRSQRNIGQHEADQRKAVWKQIEPKRNDAATVAVLGLGIIGTMTAELFHRFGFNVIGWSRSSKSIEGIDCRHGRDALPGVLAESHYVAAILPSTPETRGLFDDALFDHMRDDAVIINAGRGTLIDESALIAALDRGALSGAVLDVFNREPLPENHPFWRHPRITVTPHISGWNVDDSLPDVAENYRRLLSGARLLNEVDRSAGY